MNRIFSLVWNRTLRAPQVASELAEARCGASDRGAVLPGSWPRTRLALSIAGALALVGGLAVDSTAWAATSVKDSPGTQVLDVSSNGTNWTVQQGTLQIGDAAHATTLIAGYDGPVVNVLAGATASGTDALVVSAGSELGGKAGAGGYWIQNTDEVFGGRGSNHGATDGSANDGGSRYAAGQGAANSGGQVSPWLTNTPGTGGLGGIGGGNGATGEAGSGGSAFAGGGGGGGGGLADLGVGGGGGSSGGVGQLHRDPGVGAGGGGLGTMLAADGSNAGTITGGTGGTPNTAYGYGGAGGGGGAGALLRGSIAFGNSGSVLGGAGGAGAAAQEYDWIGAGGGGGGGAAVLLTHGDGTSGPTFTNTGTVAGGNGGANGVGSSGTAFSQGGAGIASDGDATVINSGSISGGLSGDGTTRANAVYFSGGGNTLTLENGYKFVGNVVSASGTSNGGDTLALGGDTNGTFNFAQIVAAAPTSWNGAAQYFGFNKFEKTGSSTWGVTGNAGAAFNGGIDVADGTLQVGDGSTAASINGGPVNVEAGATLGGFGTVGASMVMINNGATLSPGDAAGDVGTLTIDGPLNMLGNLAIGIDGTGAGNFDVLDVAGDATFGSSSVFNFSFGTDANQHAGDTFQFFNANSFLSFADASNNFSCSGLLAGLSCMLGMNSDDSALILTLDSAGTRSVPEPGSLGMLGVGLLLLGGGAGWRKWRDGREA